MELLPCTHIPREQFAQSPCVCKEATRKSRRKRGKLRTPEKASNLPQDSQQTRDRREWCSGMAIACRAFKSTRKISSFSLISMSKVGVASHKSG